MAQLRKCTDFPKTLQGYDPVRTPDRRFSSDDSATSHHYNPPT